MALATALVVINATIHAAPLGMGNAMRMAQVRATLESGREPILVGGQLFRLEVAVTPGQWERGLMGRDRLEPDDGMIFVYPHPQLQSFWMANCLIDIDILFVDANGRIISLHAMKAEPPRGTYESESVYHDRLPRYSSGRPAQFAIELPAGSIDELTLQRGNVVHFDRPRLIRRAR